MERVIRIKRRSAGRKESDGDNTHVKPIMIFIMIL